MTNQPLADALPVIETILHAGQPTAADIAPASSQDGAKGWKAIEEQVAAWAPPSGESDLRTDEDGYLLPNCKTITVALLIAARLREAGVTVPLRSGQTANGGINFEWRSGNRTERLTVNAEGETELAKFEDSRLVSRMPIALGPAPR